MGNLTLGKRIKTERLRLGYNQSAFAKLGDVSQTTQAAYESDSRRPDVDYLILLTACTEFDQNFVLTGKRLQQIVTNNLDWDILHEIFATIEYWEESKNLVVPLKKKFDLAQVLYGQFSETGEINEPTMQAALRLIA